MDIELVRGRTNSVGTWYHSALYDSDGYWVQSTQESCYNGYSEEEIEDMERKQHAAMRIAALREQLADWERVLGDDL